MDAQIAALRFLRPRGSGRGGLLAFVGNAGRGWKNMSSRRASRAGGRTVARHWLFLRGQKFVFEYP
jgi:hypothetical protein